MHWGRNASFRQRHSWCRQPHRPVGPHLPKRSHSPQMPLPAETTLHGIWMPDWGGQNTSRVQILCVQQLKNSKRFTCANLCLHAHTTVLFCSCSTHNNCHNGGEHVFRWVHSFQRRNANRTQQHLQPYWWSDPGQSESSLAEALPHSRPQTKHTFLAPRNKCSLAAGHYWASELAVQSRNCSAWWSCGYRERSVPEQPVQCRGKRSWPETPCCCTATSRPALTAYVSAVLGVCWTSFFSSVLTPLQITVHRNSNSNKHQQRFNFIHYFYSLTILNCF